MSGFYDDPNPCEALRVALAALVDALEDEWDSEDEGDDGLHERSLDAILNARAALRDSG